MTHYYVIKDGCKHSDFDDYDQAKALADIIDGEVVYEVLENSLLNVTHTHICLRLGDLEELAEWYLKESQKHKSAKSYKLANICQGKREMILEIIAKFNELENESQLKAGWGTLREL